VYKRQTSLLPIYLSSTRKDNFRESDDTLKDTTMDNKKDIISYRTDKRALSEKGQNLSETATAEQTGTGNPISGQQVSFSVFLNKKTEKLTTALYMVTSFLSDNEPLKWKLRERAVDLLSDISSVRNSNTGEVENIYADHSFAVEEMVSLLEVAVASKLISEMNFSILKKEYLSLKALIDSDEYAEKKTGRFIFSQNFFPKREKLESTANGHKQLIKDSTQESDITKEEGNTVDSKGQTRSTTPRTTLPTLQGQKNSFTGVRPTKKTNSQARTFKDIKAGKTNRRDAVLKLFKKNKELTIKDISREVSGCSEKTIQRELIALVSKGVLNKKGERRWSRYSLK